MILKNFDKSPYQYLEKKIFFLCIICVN